MKIFSPILKGTTTMSQGTTNLSGSFTGSLFGTAATASYADNFTVGGTLTAQTINVQIITSSIEFNTGSTRNGALSSNTHQFTGSVLMSGSLGIGTSSPNASWGATIANSTLYSSNALRLERNGIPTQGLNISAGGEVVTFNGFNTASDGLNSAFVFTSTAFNTTTERMRITSDGNVIIGNTTNPYPEIFAVYGAKTRTAGLPQNQISAMDTTAYAAGVGGAINFGGYYSSTAYTGWASIEGNKENATNGDYGGYLGFYTRVMGGSNTERMRITSGGNVNIGRTADNTGTGTTIYSSGQIYVTTNGSQSMLLTRTNNDGKILIFYKDASEVGSISTNTYSLPSDLNFKKNINNLDLGLNLVDKLRPVSYNHKIDDEGSALSTGFIAQELEQSLTELGVNKNEYYILQHKPNEDKTQSQYWLDYTKLIPVLVKSIQELKAEIDILKQQ
jgi:hypothetical protein